MEDIRLMARLLVRGHMTVDSATITVRIALMTSAFSDLEVKSDHILNANIQVP